MKNNLLIILLIGTSVAKAQQLVFDMSAFGINFGKMTVTKSIEADSTELYTLHAKGYLKVLWMERDDETKQEVRYRNGTLYSSTYSYVESGKMKKWANISFDGSKYFINSHKGKQSLSNKIHFSMLKLYFDNISKLKNEQELYHESELGYARMVIKDANTIEVKSPEGNLGIYRYKNGQLNNMEFQIAIATVHMKRIN